MLPLNSLNVLITFPFSDVMLLFSSFNVMMTFLSLKVLLLFPCCCHKIECHSFDVRSLFQSVNVMMTFLFLVISSTSNVMLFQPLNAVMTFQYPNVMLILKEQSGDISNNIIANIGNFHFKIL